MKERYRDTNKSAIVLYQLERVLNKDERILDNLIMSLKRVT